MELKSLLSIVIAVLTALGAMLFAMGTQSPWLATGVWMAAVVSLLFTDFLGKLRLPRNLASFAMWGVMAIYLPYFVVQSDWDNKLRSVANILLCLQIVLLFQAKDSRTYGWLAVMSLLQVVVAARYTQGVAFGAVMILYTVVGTFALSLLALYGPWESHGSAAQCLRHLQYAGNPRRTEFKQSSAQRAVAPVRCEAKLQQRAGGQRPLGRGLRVIRAAGADRHRGDLSGSRHLLHGAPSATFPP